MGEEGYRQEEIDRLLEGVSVGSVGGFEFLCREERVGSRISALSSSKEEASRLPDEGSAEIAVVRQLSQMSPLVS